MSTESSFEVQRETEHIEVPYRHFGSTCLNIPVNYTVITYGFSILLIYFIAFITFAEFSEKYKVRGYLNTTHGLAKIYPTQPGIIVKSYVEQGKQVKQGEPLFLIDTTYDALAKHIPQAEYIELRKRKQMIEKEIIKKQQHLKDLQSLLKKHYIAKNVYQTGQDEITTLQQTLHQLDMALIKYKQARAYTIRAPIDGTISDVIYQTGQYINPSKLLLMLLPKKINLILQLYVPIAKSGFVKINDPIVIHYDAYPYQQFGTAKALITEISRTVLTDKEEDKPFQISEPYYRITARLATQTIQIQHAQYDLHQGMTCYAIISGAKKRIWQWIFDPLYRR